MTVLHMTMLKRTYSDEAGDNAVAYVLGPMDIVFKPDISEINSLRKHACVIYCNISRLLKR